MGKPYVATFPQGSKVRVISKPALEAFARDWKYHHKLEQQQLQYADVTATVKSVGFYYGGDQLYVLDNVYGIWHETCLEAIP